MSEYVRICSQQELPGVGSLKEFVVSERALCVANVGGTICVLDGACPHEGGPLAEGSIEGGKILCPWHAYGFDPKTGVNDEDLDMKAQVFEAKVEDGELRAKL